MSRAMATTRKEVFWKDVPKREKYQFLPNTYANQFQHTFGVSPKRFESSLSTIVYRQYRLDIIKFDNEYIEKKFPNYIDDGYSMKTIIQKEWGDDALKLVMILANIEDEQ